MRELALKWWRSLNLTEKQEFINLHFPGHSFNEIDSSSSRIETIYRRENKQ